MNTEEIISLYKECYEIVCDTITDRGHQGESAIAAVELTKIILWNRKGNDNDK